jgi:hypothetical protein
MNMMDDISPLPPHRCPWRWAVPWQPVRCRAWQQSVVVSGHMCPARSPEANVTKQPWYLPKRTNNKNYILKAKVCPPKAPKHNVIIIQWNLWIATLRNEDILWNKDTSSGPKLLFSTQIALWNEDTSQLGTFGLSQGCPYFTGFNVY